MQRLKRWLLNKLTSHLLPTTQVRGVLTLDKQLRMYEDGVMLTPQALASLRQEVLFLQDSLIWKYINSNVNSEAAKLMYHKSQTLMDMTIAKTILYTLDVQKNILESIKKSKSA